MDYKKFKIMISSSIIGFEGNIEQLTEYCSSLYGKTLRIDGIQKGNPHVAHCGFQGSFAQCYGTQGIQLSSLVPQHCGK